MRGNICFWFIFTLRVKRCRIPTLRDGEYLFSFPPLGQDGVGGRQKTQLICVPVTSVFIYSSKAMVVLSPGLPSLSSHFIRGSSPTIPHYVITLMVLGKSWLYFLQLFLCPQQKGLFKLLSISSTGSRCPFSRFFLQ